jgi:hypothetical protein
VPGRDRRRPWRRSFGASLAVSPAGCQTPSTVTDVDAKHAADLAAIDDAFVAQWSLFGQGPGGTFHDEGDLVWIEAPIPQLPYNAILRVRLGDDAHGRLAPIAEHFREIGHQLLCPIMPLSTPRELGTIVEAVGLSSSTRITGMSLDLRRPRTSAARRSRRTGSSTAKSGAMRTSMRTRSSWGSTGSFPRSARVLPAASAGGAGTGRCPGVRWVAYMDGRAVGKAYRLLRGSLDVVGIFGVSVRNEARGPRRRQHPHRAPVAARGELGRQRAVLHSTPMAVSLYRRIGFVERCEIPTYARPTSTRCRPPESFRPPRAIPQPTPARSTTHSEARRTLADVPIRIAASGVGPTSRTGSTRAHQEFDSNRTRGATSGRRRRKSLPGRSTRSARSGASRRRRRVPPYGTCRRRNAGGQRSGTNRPKGRTREQLTTRPGR